MRLNRDIRERIVDQVRIFCLNRQTTNNALAHDIALTLYDEFYKPYRRAMSRMPPEAFRMLSSIRVRGGGSAHDLPLPHPDNWRGWPGFYTMPPIQLTDAMIPRVEAWYGATRSINQAVNDAPSYANAAVGGFSTAEELVRDWPLIEPFLIAAINASGEKQVTSITPAAPREDIFNQYSGYIQTCNNLLGWPNAEA